MNNNGVNNNEEIKAAKVYKLTPENAPKEIPKTETPVWEQRDKEREQGLKQQVVAPKPVEVQKIKSKNIIARFLFLIIILMGAYIVYSNYTNKVNLAKVNSLSTPVTTLGQEKKLDLKSSLVLDLYNRVKTNIREDIAEPELNEKLKLYLAYRAIPHDKFYESNCDGFDNALMIPYTCPSNISTYTPQAFNKESLKIEYEKLFGENSNFIYDNIQIGQNCIGGYQYIESRGEYVEGTCTENVTTTFKVNKQLVSATSKESTIILKEKVKYTSSEGQKVPEILKSGTYQYIFKLDKNYNYILANKILEQE